MTSRLHTGYFALGTVERPGTLADSSTLSLVQELLKETEQCCEALCQTIPTARKEFDFECRKRWQSRRA
jgi:hypothetical protein